MRSFKRFLEDSNYQYDGSIVSGNDVSVRSLGRVVVPGGDGGKDGAKVKGEHAKALIRRCLVEERYDPKPTDPELQAIKTAAAGAGEQGDELVDAIAKEVKGFRDHLAGKKSQLVGMINRDFAIVPAEGTRLTGKTTTVISAKFSVGDKKATRDALLVDIRKAQGADKIERILAKMDTSFIEHARDFIAAGKDKDQQQARAAALMRFSDLTIINLEKALDAVFDIKAEVTRSQGAKPAPKAVTTS